ncbi:hypothetical protein HD806DRAFT_177855 [Xylariaceae sp. AK1471]|nr:hypothetical protein HD806DRAFT_177855 [Xylariaceae sp. AK1471]
MMELDNSPEAPGTESLKGVPLKELQSKIDKIIIANMSRSEVFNALMLWFNEQIKQDIITQQESLLEEFLELLLMRNHAEIEPFSLAEINEVFNEWLEKDAIETPTYRRRYLITQQDVHRLFAKGRRLSQNLYALSPFDRQRRQQEDHSSALSCKQEDKDVRAKKEATNKLQETDHNKALSDTQHPISPKDTKVIEIDDDDLNQSNGPTTTDARQSNRAYFQDAPPDEVIITRETIVLNSSPDTRMSHTPTRKNRAAHKYKAHSDAPDFSTPPPRSYICKRCHEPGRTTLADAASPLTDTRRRTLDSALSNKSRP